MLKQLFSTSSNPNLSFLLQTCHQALFPLWIRMSSKVASIPFFDAVLTDPISRQIFRFLYLIENKKTNPVLTICQKIRKSTHLDVGIEVVHTINYENRWMRHLQIRYSPQSEIKKILCQTGFSRQIFDLTFSSLNFRTNDNKNWKSRDFVGQARSLF